MKKIFLAAVGGILLSASLATEAQIAIRIGPPPPIVERRPPPPRPGWTWQGGYQRWDGTRYVWTPGTWVEPPRRHARWIQGHYRHTREGYVWIEGHWR